VIAGLLAELRYAARTLRRGLGFTIVALLTLALGIGANTALFSVVNAVLLRPLPFPQADRIVKVASTVNGHDAAVSPADFHDWRRMAGSFTDVAAITDGSFALSGDGPAEQLAAEYVTDGFFRIMGVAPALGRPFAPDEFVVGQDRAVIISDALWRSRFGADRSIVGRTLRLDGDARTVVGVMPPGFDFPGERAIWVPLAFDARLAAMRGGHYLDVLGRLRPGVTVDQAAREMTGLATRIRADNPGVNIDWSATAVSLREATVGDVRPALLVLLGAVGLVLLIACVNVANLLLARGASRAREHAVRAALGASAPRLATAVLAESLWLGLGGAALGVLLASWGTSAFVAIAPPGVPGIRGARVDGTVLAFALAAGVLTSLLFGLLPALSASRARVLADRLRDGGAALGSVHGRRSRHALVTAEVSLAVVLVVGAGLLLRSFVQLRTVDPGFDPRGVLTFDVSLPDASPPARNAVFFASLLEREAALPGVRSAGAIFGLPLRDFGYGITISELDGRAIALEEQERGVVPQVRVVSRDFFRTLGIRLVRGRTFEATDRDSAPPVVVLSETAARRIFPGQDALGHRVVLGTRLGLGETHARVGGEVVGVVQDVHDQSLAREGRPWLYVVHDQFPVGFMSVVVRTEGDPSALVNPSRATLATVNADVPMFHVRTMNEWISASMAANRFYAMLTAVFGVLALGLAGVGIYGVLAQAVGERTREIGLRIALGASTERVIAQVVRDGLRPAAAGLGLGLALAFALTRALARFLTPMLYAVGPSDATTYVLGAVVMLVLAGVAAFLPARRAARVDPMVALRAD